MMACLLFVGFMVIWAFLLDIDIRERFDAPFESIPAHLYSRPLSLSVDKSMTEAALIGALKSRGYKPTAKINAPGQYLAKASVIDIATFDGQPWKVPATTQVVRIIFQKGHIQSLTDHQTGKLIGQLELAPDLLGSLDTGPMKDRLKLQVHDTPPVLLDALMVMEDRRFTQHHGVDPKGVLRALTNNVLGRASQGGSTLTQQLVKNLYLTPERTLKRKFTEMVMALLVELHYSKGEILERYLNEIFLGQSGNRAIHGFRLASRFYFNRELVDLRADQIATLVGLIPAPSAYNPVSHPERSKQRRDLVLTKLAENGYISPSEYELYIQRPMDVVPGHQRPTSHYPAFSELVNRQISSDYAKAYFDSVGHSLYTTLDPNIQAAVEHTVGTKLSELEQQHNIDTGFLQAAVIVLEAQTGEVVAMVGARNPKEAGFNRALTAKRSIGSLIKPAVYLSALEKPGQYSLATRLDDSPITVPRKGGADWQPTNYDNEFHQNVSVYDALVKSYNVPTVRVGLGVGVPTVIETLRRLGVDAPIKPYPSLLLGAVDLSVLEVAQMFQVFANDGIYQPLHAVRNVVNQHGDRIIGYQSRGTRVVDANVNYLLKAALSGITREGTARALTRLLPGIDLAGKTGTTNDYRDSWFAGFDKNYTTVVWVGNDANQSTGLSGSSGALRVWADVMGQVELHSINLTPPAHIAMADVDLSNGQLAISGCTVDSRRQPFIEGYQPLSNTACQRVTDTLGSWLETFFSSKKPEPEKPEQKKSQETKTRATQPQKYGEQDYAK